MAQKPDKTYFVRFPATIAGKLKDAAVKDARTVAAVIRIAVERYLNGGK